MGAGGFNQPAGGGYNFPNIKQGGGGGGSGTPYASTPEKQGTGSAGASSDYARGDHVHPFRSRYYIGAFKLANLTASSTTSMGYGGNSNPSNEQWAIIVRAGKVTHITCDQVTLPISAGSYQVQIRTATLAGSVTVFSAAGEILTVAGDRRSLIALANPVSVAAGDMLGVQLVSDASLTPATTDPVVTLMFEED